MGVIHIVRKGFAKKRMFACEEKEGVSKVTYVRIKILALFQVGETGKMRIYTYTRNKPTVSFTLSFIAFVVYAPLFHFCFAVEQNIVLRNLLFLSLSQNTREKLLMKSKKSASVLLNLPNVTVQKFE